MKFLLIIPNTLDIEEAFNNASLTFLLNVMWSKGIADTVICWIDFMLSNRIVTATSGITNLEACLWKGLPQGRVLSALMWILVERINLSTICSAAQLQYYSYSRHTWDLI